MSVLTRKTKPCVLRNSKLRVWTRKRNLKFWGNQDSQFAGENEIRCFGETKINIFDRNLDSDVLEKLEIPILVGNVKIACVCVCV